MSREERKMAQIIASIERMEQAPAAKVPKGKKSKAEGKSKGRRIKVASPSSAEAASAALGRKLTPKKRWIQLWSAHLQDAASEKEEAPESEDALQATPEREKTEASTEQADETPVTTSVSTGSAEKADSTTAVTTEAAEAATSAAEPSTGTDTGESEGLRVKTPLHAEASHLSPPVERSSSPSAAAASISPSAKAKEDESPPTSNTSTESASSSSSVAAAVPTDAVKSSPTSAVEKRSGATLIKANSTSSLTSDTRVVDGERESRKRSLERDPSTMTEEERRRAERRRKRKSNWDVGDPRFGGSPANSADGASPFGRFPPGRPTWRHSNSLDVKHFPPYRSSFHNNGGPPPTTPAGPRRGFYHSNSMPMDRSRSAGRPSRYGYGGNNYR